MADLLSEQRTAIDQRLEELRPLHQEYLQLERAKTALESLDGGARRRPARTRGAGGPGAGAGRRRGRPRGRSGGSGTRAEQALAAVREQPGITVNELAERLEVPQKNYLYRIMNGLQSEGAVEKHGRGFVATGAGPEAA